MSTDPVLDSNSDPISGGDQISDADQRRIEEARLAYQRALGRGAGLVGTLSEITKDFSSGIGRASLACSISLTALRIALSRYGTWDVVASDVEQVTADCGALLGSCLADDLGLPAEERMTPAARLRVLHLLYDLWWFDTAAGGLAAAGMESHLFRGATSDERSLLSQWLLRDGKYHSDLPRLWHVVSREYFRAMLETGEEPENEILLNKFRANSLHEAAAALLIDMDRPEEALIEARQSSSAHTRIRIADAILACGEAWVEPALGLVEERLKTAEEARDETTAIECLRWIIRRCEELGQISRAIDAARRWFQLQPGYSTYLRVRSLGEGWLNPEKWRDLRDHMLGLFKERRDWDTLVRILLGEGDIREARQQLAAAIEREDPDRAAALREG